MLYLGADHGGFKLKESVKKLLDKKNIRYVDLGNKYLVLNDDYPDFAKKVAKKVGNKNKGVLFCGTGLGMCIAANKIKNTRAVNVSNVKDAKMSRMHNDSNVLCLSGWNVLPRKAVKIIQTWMNTPFSDEERHRRRVRKIE